MTALIVVSDYRPHSGHYTFINLFAQSNAYACAFMIFRKAWNECLLFYCSNAIHCHFQSAHCWFTFDESENLINYVPTTRLLIILIRKSGSLIL